MSPMNRVYLPLRHADLQTLASRSALPGDRAAYAVTSALIRALPVTEDEEGREYAALQDAALAAAAAGDHVVAAVDVDAGLLGPAQTPGAADPDAPASLVRLTGDLPLRRVVSLHVLDPVGERDVDADLELSWWDVTELAEVVRVVAAR